MLLSIAAALITFSISLYFYEDNRENSVYLKYIQAIQVTNKQHAQDIKLRISSQKKNIQLISDLSGIQNFIHAQNSANIQGIKEQITTSFKALLKQEEDIRQARLILTNGMEFIRVERNNSEVINTPSNLLQSKENRNYFKTGISLRAGEIYISDISPNYEHGKLDTPIWPTYRIIKNLIDTDGTVFGLLVLNIDASSTLEQINSTYQPTLLPFESFLINSNGYYVAAPSPDFLYGDELANKHMNWFEHTAQSTPLIRNNRIHTLFMGEPYLFSSQEIVLSDQYPENIYYLISGLATKKIDAEIQSQRKELLISVGIFVSFLMLIVYFYSKYIKQQQRFHHDQSSYKAIIANSSDAIFSIKATGEILNWNQAATILFGLNSTEAIGQNFLNLVVNKDKPELNSSFLEALLKKKSNIRLEVSPKKNRKSERSLLMTLCPINLGENNKNSIALIIQDVTHQKANQKKLEEMNLSLETKVEQRTKELEAEKQKAQSANQIKSMFVANISHEIRTHLNGVTGLLALARDKKNQDKQDEYLSLA